MIYFGEYRALVAECDHGMLAGMRLFDLDLAASPEKARERFILSHYDHAVRKSCWSIEQVLRESNYYPDKIILPSRGTGRDLLYLCRINYEYRVKFRKYERAGVFTG